MFNAFKVFIRRTLTSPTANLSGAAGDVKPPVVGINIAQQSGAAIVTISANDNASGVSRIWYSFDGQTFQRYVSAVTIQYSPNPVIIKAFADDAAANRSGLSAKTFSVAPPVPTLAVKPVLECVQPNADGSFTAKFGYLNENAFPATVVVGAANKFTPAPVERGQTTAFQAGRIRFAFNVLFDGNNLVWTLKSPNNTTRTSTAARNSARCQ